MRYQWWTGGVATYFPPNIFTLAFSILKYTYITSAGTFSLLHVCELGFSKCFRAAFHFYFGRYIWGLLVQPYYLLPISLIFQSKFRGLMLQMRCDWSLQALQSWLFSFRAGDVIRHLFLLDVQTAAHHRHSSRQKNGHTWLKCLGIWRSWSVSSFSFEPVVYVKRRQERITVHMKSKLNLFTVNTQY